MDAHIVCVEEVVAEIQLAEPERYGKAGEVRGLSGCAVEGDVEVGPFGSIALVFAIDCAFSLMLGDVVQVDFLQTNPEGSRCGLRSRHCEIEIGLDQCDRSRW